MLDYTVHANEPGDHPEVLIFMHGLGGSNQGGVKWGVAPLLRPNQIVIAPNGPYRLRDHQEMFAWFLNIRDDLIHTDLLIESCKALKKLVDAVPKIVGKQPSKVMLSGFSQGGTMAVTYPLLYPGTIEYSACVAGYIARDPQIPVTPETVRGTKFWWHHGKRDWDNDFYLAAVGTKRLKNAQADLAFLVHPTMGHANPPQVIKSMLSWFSTH